MTFGGTLLAVAVPLIGAIIIVCGVIITFLVICIWNKMVEG